MRKPIPDQVPGPMPVLPVTQSGADSPQVMQPILRPENMAHLGVACATSTPSESTTPLMVPLFNCGCPIPANPPVRVPLAPRVTEVPTGTVPVGASTAQAAGMDPQLGHIPSGLPLPRMATPGKDAAPGVLETRYTPTER